MFNKDLKLMAIDNENGEVFKVDSLHLPLGSPSGKDIVVVSNNDNKTGIWKSIDEVDIYPNQYATIHN